MRRTYIPDIDDKPIVRIVEELENCLTFERVLGRSQHVSIGKTMLAGGCKFSCNADHGLTWPEETDTFKRDTKFDYPNIPCKPSIGERPIDWRTFPRKECQSNSDLCTLRISPAEKYGWFVAQKKMSSKENEDNGNISSPIS